MGNTTLELGAHDKRGDSLMVKGSYQKKLLGASMNFDSWVQSNAECLSVWRAESSHGFWGEHCGLQHFTNGDMHEWHAAWPRDSCWTQGLQPYVYVENHYDNPIPQDQDKPSFDIDIGVDSDFACVVEPGRNMSNGNDVGRNSTRQL